MAETRSSQDWITSPKHAALIIVLVLLMIAIIGVVIAVAGNGGDNNDTSPGDTRSGMPATVLVR